MPTLTELHHRIPTLTDLYRRYTGDLTAHQRTIGKHFRELDQRRQRIVTRVMDGLTYGDIGAEETISRAAAHSVVTDAMLAIRRAIDKQH